MKFKNSLSQNSGFTLLQLLVAIGVVSAFSLAISGYTFSLNKTQRISRYMSTRDRTVQGLRNLASMPAALRVSMRASNASGTVVNPELLACIGANPANSCQNGVSSPFTLYSPIISRLPTGEIIGIQPVSAPLGATQPFKLNSMGTPCAIGEQDCPFWIYTSFRPQCAPSSLPSGTTPTTADLVAPATCSVADVIEVTFQISLDPRLATTDPNLYTLMGSISGTTVVEVLPISGNKPE